jgi:hypothetical protein
MFCRIRKPIKGDVHEVQSLNSISGSYAAYIYLGSRKSKMFPKKGGRNEKKITNLKKLDVLDGISE